ncbi:hypothetical protein [Paenibacillus antarcticus]|uniref:hypothetical protein n=1 Tax=Paenibacillus antarcticus TaxID=253703 RepID=UPI000A9A1D42|nr:hypothetical protein [Paenibacillus antarcticus]
MGRNLFRADSRYWYVSRKQFNNNGYTAITVTSINNISVNVGNTFAVRIAKDPTSE